MNVRPLVPFALAVLAFAALVTLHVAATVGIARRRGALAAAAAFVVFPTAPFVAARAGMRARAYAWGVAFVAYGVALAALLTRS